MELVTGASGYVGGRLLRRLAREGRPVRALARVPERVEPLEGVETRAGDLLSGEGLDSALEGVSTAYYLVHSMEAAPGDGFAARDRRAAEAFAAAAASAGVERVVYLGGIAPAGAAFAPPALAARGGGDPARRRAGVDRAAGVDRDRRRLVLVQGAGPARRAAASASDAALALQPHPARGRA